MLILPSSASAQVNTENMLPSADTEGLELSFALTAGLNRGNSEFTSLGSNIRLDWQDSSTFTSFLVGNIDYKEGNDSKIAHKGFLHLRGIYNLWDWAAPEAFAQKQFNAFTNLIDRTLLGGGIRFIIMDSEGEPDSVTHSDLMVGIGAMYENELLGSPAGYRTEIPRSTNYINYKLRTPGGIGFSTVAYYQPSLTFTDDWRSMATASLTFPIIKGLSFIVNFDYSYDNEPPTDINKYDYELTNGLRLRL
jgi:hypothetical protein